jgi:integrase
LKEAVAGTVVKEFRTLQATLNAAVKWDVISRNPIANVEAPRDFTSRPPRWFTREELARIYAIELEIPKFTTPSDAELHRRMRCSWQLIANTGMRRAEALPLQWRDIGAEEIGIRSEQDARTKSGKWRAIPISRVARESLEELHADETYVIPQMAPASVS